MIKRVPVTDEAGDIRSNLTNLTFLKNAGQSSLITSLILEQLPGGGYI